MTKLTLRSLDARAHTVLVRVDYNVPLTDEGVVRDDSRIRATLPTVRYLVDHGARVVLMSHLGRPKGKRVPSLSLRPVVDRLGTLLGRPVAFADECVGDAVSAAVRALPEGGVLLLENLRFHPEEEANDPTFAASLASLGDRYVDDAFGAAHRAHASTVGVPHLLPQAAAGFLMERELDFLGRLLGSPERPFAAVIGGAKISGKIDVLRSLLTRVDTLVIGGAMMFTFLRAQGLSTGRSLVEEDRIETASEILRDAEARGVQLLLPLDCIASTATDGSAPSRVAGLGDLASDEIGVDIGPRTIEAVESALEGARTIFWNGPMGVFETEPFAAGTLAVAACLARATEVGAVTVVGGGDSVAALAKSGLTEKISHVSTGGGASLEFLEGRELPGVAALTDAARTMTGARESASRLA
jgi:phosphoglycerate kinase